MHSHFHSNATVQYCHNPRFAERPLGLAAGAAARSCRAASRARARGSAHLRDGITKRTARLLVVF